MVLLEYIWLDAYGTPRSKTKLLKRTNKWFNDFGLVNAPEWNYDGSSTGQAEGSKSEIILKPCRIFKDPFRGDCNYLVLCDTYNPDNTPHETNTRNVACKIFDKYYDQKPLYGIEQEFFITKGGRPLGFIDSQPKKQGEYYCGVGTVVGRDFIEEALENCLKAELDITGLNAEVAPSQWEFQVCAEGIKACDQLYILRYILLRTAEKYGYSVDFHPKPIAGDWNGSGCHTNFSTRRMRENGGYEAIKEAIQKLKENHELHMRHYGTDNDKRMTGLHETSSFDKFTWGVGSREASVRVPRDTELNGKGYFEDRRPASNMDPYKVCSIILETINK